jgi:iron-sulfur cluster insertion protein
MNAAVEMPAPLSFSDSAAAKVKQLIDEEGNPELKLRVFVQGGGCSGFQYGFTFDEVSNEDDTAMVKNGVTLLIDSMSYQYLVGAEIDYKEDLEGAQFVIKNPNATTTCGCGSSFSVERAQHARAARPGDGRQVSGARLDVRSRQPGKGERFHLLGRYPQTVARAQHARRTQVRERCHQRRVARAPPADDHVGRIGGMARDRPRNARRGQCGQRGLHAGRGQRRMPGEPCIEPARVEEIAAGALRRRQREERVGQQVVEECLVHAARRGEVPVGIERLPEMALRPQVEQHVARAAVEADNLAAAACAGQRGDVGDAADIDHGACLRCAEDRSVECRHQRRALAAGGDVARAEIGYDVDAAEFGQQCWRVELDRVAELGAMANGLAMGADGAHPGRIDAGGREQRTHRLRAGACQVGCGKRGAMQFVVAGGVQCQQCLAQRRRERLVGVCQRARLRTREVGQHRIDAVETGAGHQSDEAR